MLIEKGLISVEPVGLNVPEGTPAMKETQNQIQRRIEAGQRVARDHIIMATLLKRGPQTVDELSEVSHINTPSIETSLLRLDLRGHISWTKAAVSLLNLPESFTEQHPDCDAASVSEDDLVGEILFTYALAFPGAEDGAIMMPRDTFFGVLAPTTQETWCKLACPVLKEHGIIDMVHPSVHTPTCRCSNLQRGTGSSPGVSA